MNQADVQFRLTDVSKGYGKDRVIKNLSFAFYAGELTLLIGANGAGKSTLLKMFAGLSNPDSGSLEYRDPKGEDFVKYSTSISQKISYLGHQLMLYRNLTVAENLSLFNQLGSFNADLKKILEEWHLESFHSKVVGTLSKGTQFRVSLARAFLGDPNFVFLDEPTSSLDEVSFELFGSKLRSLVLDKSKGRIIVIASHDLSRLLPISDRVVLLDGGTIANDSRASDKGMSGSEEVFIQVVTEYRRRNR